MDRHYAMLIDEEACWGCRTCEVACKQEFHQPEGLVYIRVWEDGPHMHGPRPGFVYRVRICRHCEAPECAAACPEEAIEKRPDGIVLLDEERCSGCGACITACPFQAVSFDHRRQVACKCNMCHHRLEAGLPPACADNVCLAHCIHFGRPEAVQAAVAQDRARRARA